MKKCNKCGQSDVLFNKNKSKSDGFHSTCKECQKEHQNAWYQKHKATHVANVLVRSDKKTRETYEKITRYLQEHPCVDCGESDIVVLEFDHVRGQKTGHVSRMSSNGTLWPVIEAEIAKCDVRCANCHRRKTAKQRNWYRGGGSKLYGGIV